MSTTITRTPEQKRNIRKWVRALRSGNYKQGQGTLCKYDRGEFRYCCLGVVSDLAVAGAEWVEHQGGGNAFGKYRLVGPDGRILGSGMISQTQLDSLVGPGLSVDTLAGMNDGSSQYKRRKFVTIAKYIEDTTGVKA